MKTFSKKVDLRSKKDMISYLTTHFRYNTMNSWNCSTSYANNIKIYNLGLSEEEKDKLYELINVSEFYDKLQALCYEFGKKNNYLWQARFNGRNNGYIVLYQGHASQSKYKSVCTLCGQRNYKTVEETENCKCGKCGNETRVNYKVPPIEYGAYLGRPIDMNEDFEDWDMYSLRERVKLVQGFDRLCDDILSEVRYILDNFEVEEDIIYVPQTIKKLKEVS